MINKNSTRKLLLSFNMDNFTQDNSEAKHHFHIAVNKLCSTTLGIMKFYRKSKFSSCRQQLN